MNKENCYDIGTIQAFTDGELDSDLQENVVGHIALCDSCATLLADTEDESAFAFSALDEELNVLVPTERLRTKVFESIRESKEKVSWWQKLVASFGFANGFSFNRPSLVAFASIALFVGFIAIGISVYEPTSTIEMAKVGDITEKTEVAKVEDVAPKKVSTDNDISTPDVVEKDEVVVKAPAKTQLPKGFQVVKTGGIKKEKKRKKVITKKNRIKPKTATATNPTIKTPKAPLPSPNLSGEDSYLQTIATLSRTVDRNKDITLRPTERVAFEKDMAMVDDAIKKMKREVRKNPKNQAAREVLRSSYKNKIDLLNSVAEKSELMASIQ